MNEEQKRILMVGFIIPFACMVLLYFFLISMMAYFIYHLPDPSIVTLFKYAFAKYTTWIGWDVDVFSFTLPEEFIQDIYEHIGLTKVVVSVYPKSVDMFVKPPLYRWFPAYLIIATSVSFYNLIRKSRGDKERKSLKKKESMQQYIRGARIVDERKFVLDSKRLVKDPIASLPTKSGNLLISDYRCKGHIFLLGSTGTGKSETLSNLLGGILDKHKDVKVIYADRKGEFYSKFGRKGDILFNPYDARTVGWSLFNEIRFDKNNLYDSIPADLTMMAKILFPTEGKNETIWDNAAARIFESVMCYCFLNKKTTMQEFYKFNQLAAADIAAALQTLPRGLSTGYGVIQDPSSKSAMSALMTYTTTMEELSCLNSIDGSWSITDWINDRTNSANLYLSSAGSNDTAFLRLITLLIDFAGREVKAFDDDGSQNLRLLFVFDELAALPKLSTLSYLLSQARSKGVGCILATQSFEQIKAIYGAERAHEIFANTKTKMIFSMPDPVDSTYLSRAIGTAEHFRTEKSQSQSTAGVWGKGDDRHGMNENQRIVEDKLFLQSQITSQKTGQAIVQFPDFDGEVAQVQFLKTNRHPVRQPAFIERNQELISGKAIPFVLEHETKAVSTVEEKEELSQASAGSVPEDDSRDNGDEMDDDDVIY